jgi:transcription elongation GreA/GreB family factor
MIDGVLNDAQHAANTETKSTAGDKHDTARAMAHLEQEKNAKQRIEIQKLKKVLPLLNPQTKCDQVELGALVFTTVGNFYISVSLGKYTYDNTDYFLISPVTPMANLLLNKKKGDVVEFKSQKIIINNIV